MAERPILFSAPMVRAILAGTKTQTRRVVKHIPTVGGPERWCSKAGDAEFARIVGDYRRFCPYGEPGDLLWVRETHAFVRGPDFMSIIYRADGAEHPCESGVLDPEPYDRMGPATAKRWRPSIHMPRWASRITLRVTEVRVERVQDISEEDAKAEGVTPDPDEHPYVEDFREDFETLWDSINAKRGFGWDANPWVWVVEFERVEDEA